MQINFPWMWFIFVQTVLQQLSPAGHLLLQHTQWFSDRVLSIWWRYPGNWFAWSPSSPMNFKVNCSRVTPSADSFVLCVLIVWYRLTAVTVFKGQIRHLPTASPIDCIDKVSKEQFLACSVRRRSVPAGPPPPPLSCGSSAGSFQPAQCTLQHRRWYLAAWMVLAVQAAVPVVEYVSYQAEC